MGLIKELAIGSFSPLNYSFKSDSECEKLDSKAREIEKKLEITLSPEQRELFREVSDANTNLYAELEEEVYVRGFIHGAQIIMEILSADPTDNMIR
jgi:hypothetical protein